MKYILNNDSLEVVGKQYLNGVGGYDGTNPTSDNDVATVINDINQIVEDNEEVIAAALNELNDRVDEIEKTQEKVFILPEDFMDEEYNEPDEDGFFGKVKQKYIPDTVLKTTPQELSDTDKNQALANLGLSDVATVINDIPIVKGDAEHSAVLKGETTVLGVTYKNEAFNEGCVSLGVGTTAGLKGWYYKAIQIGNDSKVVYLYLTTEQQIPILVSTANAVENQEKTIEVNLSKGDICSIINGDRQLDKFEFRLNEMSTYGRISFTYKGKGTNPLSIIQNVEELKLEDYSVFCISKPSCGIVELSKCNIALGNNTKSLAESSVSMGLRSTAVGITSYAEGQDTIAVGECAHAEGAFTKSNGIASHTEGFGTQTEGLSAHAEGYNTLATGGASHSEGSATKATGLHSHAEGDTTEASGEQSHAEGKQTIAEGEHSHSEGYWTKAHGKSSHVEGQGLNNTTYSVASGDYSHSEGFYTRAFGTGSHTEGTYTIAYNKGEHAEGIYNKSTENVTLHSVGIGTSVNDRKNAHEITNDGKHYIIGIGGYDGTNTDGSKDVATVLPNMVDITYLELKSLRDNSQLVPGQQYRITDYVTTTTQQYTRIAEEYHQFDIIVTADDVNVLNENARAIQHEFDDPESDEAQYFVNSNLAAWELKYCLDNDTNRFKWADTTNGKGVFYYMKDEWNIDCPYDFKNIQFARWELSNPVGYRYKLDTNTWKKETTPFDSLKEGFYGLNDSTKTYDYGLRDHIYSYYRVEYTISESPTYCYTFGKDTDYSISGSDYDNVIKENGNQLNNIVFLKSSSHNTFGKYCHRNTFGDACANNTFGDTCSYNSFGTYYLYNTFGNNCSSNTFGDNCNSNTFGDNCDYNTFGTICSNNRFGNFCDYNIFGYNCDYNTFSDACSRNGFGDYCNNNTFGNYCNNNTFGESSLKSYYRYIIFDNGNECINLNCTETTSSTNYYQNVRIGLGVNNTFKRKTINDSNVGQTYETLYKPAGSKDLTA